MTGENIDIQRTSISENIKDNGWLFTILFLGTGLLIPGMVSWNQFFIAIGVAFIIAASVGIYMMLATRQVAKNLYKRFDELDKTLKEMATSQTEMATSQKETSSSLKEMADILKRIETKL